MRKVAVWALTAALGLSVAPLAPGGKAWANGEVRVCYKTREFEPTRLVLDVKFHSQLATNRSGGRQAVWDALGKHAYTESGKNRMAVVDGAVVVSSGSKSQPQGAHMGLTSLFVRGGGQPIGGQPRPIFWDCTSNEVTATPFTWYCSAVLENDPGTTLSVTLDQLSAPDAACDVFQDTQDFPPKVK